MTAKRAPSRGRKSSLTDHQWVEIERRYLDGESVTALAAEYGVHKSAISRRFAQQKSNVKTVVNQLVTAEMALRSLPIPQQHYATTLAQRQISISMHLASAAEYGAATAHRLHAIANQQVQLVDDADPTSEESAQAVMRISGLTKVANDASMIGRELIKTTVQLPEEPALPQPGELKKLTVDDAAKAYADMIRR